MKRNSYTSRDGFTLIEMVIALAISAVVALAFFKAFTLFLQTRAESMAIQDILTTSDNILRRFNYVAQIATDLTVGPDQHELRVTGNPCALIQYKLVTKDVWYAEDATANCSPPTSTNIPLSQTPVEVTAFTFTPVTTSVNAKSVQLSFTLVAKQPFAQKTQSFSSSVTLWKQ